MAPWSRRLAVGAMIVAACGGVGAWAVTSIGRGGAPAEGAAPVCGGASYLGQQVDTDACADASGRVTLAGLTASLTPLRRATANGELCSDVTVDNQSGRSVALRSGDWSVRTPLGAERDAASAPAGDLADGARSTGTLCFPALEGSGQFATVFAPAGFDDRRAVWLTTL